MSMMSLRAHFTFFWSPPSVTAYLTGYSLTCTPLLEGIPTPVALMLEPAATTANMTGLYTGVTYSCKIITIGLLGSSEPNILTIPIPGYNDYAKAIYSDTDQCHLLTGAPEMFEAVAGQRQVKFSWSSLPVIQRNGVITSYTLSCSPSPSSLPQPPSQSGTLTVAGFSPYTSYTCSLVASNSYGSGPAVNTSFTTLKDCKTD